MEIEAEPEQVERPGSSCPGKETGKGFWQGVWGSSGIGTGDASRRQGAASAPGCS